MSDPGMPYVTWDGSRYVVRVDMDADMARVVGRSLWPDSAAEEYHKAADRLDDIEAGEPR